MVAGSVRGGRNLWVLMEVCGRLCRRGLDFQVNWFPPRDWEIVVEEESEEFMKIFDSVLNEVVTTGIKEEHGRVA